MNLKSTSTYSLFVVLHTNNHIYLTKDEKSKITMQHMDSDFGQILGSYTFPRYVTSLRLVKALRSLHNIIKQDT